MKLDNETGAFVFHVFLGSPAEKAGLLPGDFVTSINNIKINDADALVRVVGDLPAGRIAHLEVVRFGKRIKLDVEIGLRQKTEIINSKNKDLWPGLSVIPITDDVIRHMEISKNTGGVMIQTVEHETKLDIAGIKTGDIIKKINDTPIYTVADFYRQINEKGRTEFTFYFHREGHEYSITIKK
jgi:S1-C subfamily serine protease